MKLNKAMEALLDAQLQIQDKIDDIQKKMDAIQDNAGNQERMLTDKEQTEYDNLHKELVNLMCEENDLQSCIDTLVDYCE